MNVQTKTILLLPTVLIVDDDDTTRMLAQRFLSDVGFDVKAAPDGETGLGVMSEVRPDILLLDVDMPGISGFDVCRTLRADAQWRALPIMMLTASDDLDSIEAAFDAGATDFSTKPMSWALLGHRLRYLLRGAETLMELALAQRSAMIGSWSGVSGGNSMRWSAQLFDILGLDPQGAAPSWALLELSVPEKDRAKLATARVRALAGETCELIHPIVRGTDGQRRFVRHLFECVRGTEHCSALHGTIQDITERHRVDLQVKHLAYYDDMTGLPNRSAFHENLNMALSRAKRHHESLAVLYIDLDDFKRINDTLGHASGDMLLCQVAARLRSVLRSSDFVGRFDEESQDAGLARLGGDEFAVIVADLTDKTETAPVAQRILECFAAPFDLDGNEVYTSPSIGVACFPCDGSDQESLLRYADIAMYEAKRCGKNAVRFHDQAFSDAANRRNQIEMGLSNALQRGELALLYQPQLDLGSDTIVAAEALLRWQSAELGSVSPVEFIPIAEKSGLIISIGEWVLRAACQQLVAWRQAGYEFERIAVNVSVKQFVHSNFVSLVSSILAETGCPAEALELEITESVLAADADGAIAVLENIKNLGVQLSIDDFGTGYSSLSYLQKFPIDRLKIDRSFITDIVANPNDGAITAAVIGIARSMGLRVIAEGVETLDQRILLKAQGCDEMQGYSLSMPVAPQELIEKLGYRVALQKVSSNDDGGLKRPTVHHA